MPASDHQGNRFDLERRLLKEPHRFARAHVAPISVNRNVQMLAEAPPKCSGVHVELPREATDRKRSGPVDRDPTASLFMNRALQEIVPAVEERATSVLENQLGPRSPMAIVRPAVPAPFANGLVDAETPERRVELNVDFQQKPAQHEFFGKVARPRQQLDELLQATGQDRGVGGSCAIHQALAILHHAREPVGAHRKAFRIASSH